MNFDAEFSALREQIAAQGDIASIRLQIIDLIRQCLKEKKDALGDWEKAHFSNAIGALGLNIHSSHQPSRSWLRLCLIDLEKAIGPTHLRDPNYHIPDPSMRDLKYEQLLDAVQNLSKDLSG